VPFDGSQCLAGPVVDTRFHPRADAQKSKLFETTVGRCRTSRPLGRSDTTRSDVLSA